MNDSDIFRSGSPRRTVSDEEAGRTALNWAVGSGLADRVMKEAEARCARRRRLRLTGGIVALLVLGVAWQTTVRRSGEVASGKPATIQSSAKVSLPTRQLLADGSVIELNDGAQISVDFNATARRVRLHRGEAHFQVTKDTQRPFIVTAGGVDARAVGTAFFVQLDRAAVEILVTEGQVAVEKTTVAASPSSFEGALVRAGNRAVVDLGPGASAAPKVEAVSAPEMAGRFAWRVPRLEFSATPLTEVVPIFNRYSQTRIVLGDPALGAFQLSGVLRADNTHSLLRILELEFGIKAEWRGGEVILRQP